MQYLPTPLKLFLLLMCFPIVSFAHSVQSPCLAPDRPDNDQDDQAWQAFLIQVDLFRQCVSDTMRKHQNAANQHHADAKIVVDEWNHFVRASLNAPEDFPWPGDQDIQESEEAE